MTEKKMTIGLTTEVTKMAVDGDYNNRNNLGQIMYKRNIVELQLNTKGGGEDRGGKGRCWPSTLYSWALVFLTFLFVVSFVGTVVLWGTELLDEAIMQRLVVRNNTEKYDYWVNSPIKPNIAIRIFNCTNTEKFMLGLEKLRVEEIGPFTYRQTLERVNVRFNPNGTVSYQERRSHEYLPELSTGDLDDYIMVPNMPLLGASAKFRDVLHFIQLSVSFAFMSMDYQPFIRVKIKDFIWGYDDPIVKVTKALVSNLPDKIGLMVLQEGTSPFRYTVNTGEDFSRMGIIDKYKGTDRQNVWDSDQCNKVDGTDGSIFPAHWVGENQKVNIYMPHMCRKFPLVFKENVKVFGELPALRFHPPRNVFDPASSNPDNACYCNSESCPPAGVFNAARCTDGVPIMISFPHFYLGDPKLLEEVDGMCPQEDKHDMYFDMHPKFGFPMLGISRFQLNFMVKKSKIANFDAFTESSILPIAWFDAGLVELPDDIVALLYHLAFTRRNVELGILCTTAITGLTLAFVLLRCLYRSCYSRREGSATAMYANQIIMTASTSNMSDKKALDPDMI